MHGVLGYWNDGIIVKDYLYKRKIHLYEELVHLHEKFVHLHDRCVHLNDMIFSIITINSCNNMYKLSATAF
jgi:hypothetical protein